ncbi:MAG: hypothetical protein KAS53_00155 [Candidatus Cloacimonetes bacterium]|nr:hypothetical protein [Candidatus Cloacimonadota bacterium]
MKTCPFCGNEYEVKNDGNGLYHQCVKCNSKVYNLSLLKRSNYNSAIFTNLLLSAKQKHAKSSGKCFSCEQPFREVIYKANDYQTKVYVCPTCFLFAIKNLDLAVFKNSVEKPVLPEKKMSAEAEKIINEIDTKLDREQKSWILFDKSVKLTTSKTIGAGAFMIFLILSFVKIGFSYGTSTPIGKIIFGLFFIVCLIAGIILIIGKKNIQKVIEKLFSS